jgi:hypothetical protein
MNTHFQIAAGIAVFVGLAHSVLGELMIFQTLRKSALPRQRWENLLVPSLAAPPLQARHVRILWATWHIVSFFGFALSAILYSLSLEASPNTYIIHAVIVAFTSGAALVLLATRGKHPGWIGLLAAAIFVYLGKAA